MIVGGIYTKRTHMIVGRKYACAVVIYDDLVAKKYACTVFIYSYGGFRNETASPRENLYTRTLPI